MRKATLQERAQALSVAVFHEIAKRPGYEPVDEDTAIALVSAYGKEFERILAPLVEADEYLTRTDGVANYIGSESILHSKFRVAIASGIDPHAERVETSKEK